MRPRPALAAVLALGLAACARGPAPEETAIRFYDTVVRLHPEGLPDSAAMREIGPLLSDSLRLLVEATRRVQRAAQQDHPDEKPPWIEGDLFTSLFEGATTYRVGAAIGGGDGRVVPVAFVRAEAADTMRWTDTLVLRRERHRWVVTDVRYRAPWDFKPGDRLTEVLSAR